MAHGIRAAGISVKGGQRKIDIVSSSKAVTVIQTPTKRTPNLQKQPFGWLSKLWSPSGSKY